MMAVMANIVLQHEERIQKRRAVMQLKRNLRDVSNPYTIGDNVFFRHYR